MPETKRARRRRTSNRTNLLGRRGGSDARGGGGPFDASAVTLILERNLLSNGKFSANTTGWTATGSALASVAGGQDGNCLRVTNSGAASGYASQQLQIPAGKYILTLYYKNGTGTCKATVATTKGGTDIVNQALTNAAWTAVTLKFTAAAPNPWVNFFVNDTTSAHTAFYDEIVVVKDE